MHTRTHIIEHTHIIEKTELKVDWVKTSMWMANKWRGLVILIKTLFVQNIRLWIPGDVYKPNPSRS